MGDASVQCVCVCAHAHGVCAHVHVHVGTLQSLVIWEWTNRRGVGRVWKSYIVPRSQSVMLNLKNNKDISKH